MILLQLHMDGWDSFGYQGKCWNSVLWLIENFQVNAESCVEDLCHCLHVREQIVFTIIGDGFQD